ncbi:MAG: ATP-grasp domain-containing protein, partial [Candidatus Cloacimonadota bacterium]|nr:ATP-grasp domain-containing protein [Candidatus Cloacimonadota bacterium]
NSVKFPIIIKPAIGFFSMGVHKIENKSEWNSIIKKIKVEMEEIKNIYPKEVMDSTDFILEELIEGEEYAVDCYFDAQSKPVVVNILHHIFSSGADMSDRVYTASAKIIRENLDRMTEFLEKMGELTKVKNYPTHVEVRVTQSGEVIPIEANPTRFGGWCSSPDLARYSLDINIVHYFLNNQKPDWYKILQGKEDKVYSIVILDNSTGYKNEQIESFDYDKLLNHFSNPLELRKINYHEYPVFGFVFCETPQDEMDEIWDILKSDLKEFVILKNDKS